MLKSGNCPFGSIKFHVGEMLLRMSLFPAIWRFVPLSSMTSKPSAVGMYLTWVHVSHMSDHYIDCDSFGSLPVSAYHIFRFRFLLKTVGCCPDRRMLRRGNVFATSVFAFAPCRICKMSYMNKITTGSYLVYKKLKTRKFAYISFL